MKVRSPEIVVVLMASVMPLVLIAEHPRRHQIDHETHAGNEDRFVEADDERIEEPAEQGVKKGSKWSKKGPRQHRDVSLQDGITAVTVLG